MHSSPCSLIPIPMFIIAGNNTTSILVCMEMQINWQVLQRTNLTDKHITTYLLFSKQRISISELYRDNNHSITEYTSVQDGSALTDNQQRCSINKIIIVSILNFNYR